MSDSTATLQERIRTLNREETAKLDQEITDAHARVLRSSERTRQSLIEYVNAARETGLLLNKRKDETPHGQWLALFADAPAGANSNPAWNFTNETARIYMRLADRLPEAVTELPEAIGSLKDLLIANNIIAAPDGHGSQRSHALTFGSLLTHDLGGLQSRWRKHGLLTGDGLNEAKVQELSPPAKEQIHEQVRPFAELFSRLYEMTATP